MKLLSIITLLILFTLQSAWAQFLPDWSNVPVPPWPLTTPKEITNPVLTIADVTDAENPVFIADPFMFHEDNNWYMFFEVLDKDLDDPKSIDKVFVGLATSSDGLHWTYKGKVIEEPGVLLSFPAIYKNDGEYYIIPATGLSDRLRVYKATNFPYEWTEISPLLPKGYDDNSIFHYNNKWWMFAGSGNNDTCHLFYSNNLLSGWVEHPMSPIITGDPKSARPGGRSFVYGKNRVIRIAQQDAPYYGLTVKAFEVDLLTETYYSEHEISENPISAPEEREPWRMRASHTFDPWWTGDRWLVVVDGSDLPNWRTKKRTWSIGILEHVPLDTDNDSIFDVNDNCPTVPNSQHNGTCKSGENKGALCTENATCGAEGFCSMNQEDFDTDNIGDACDNCPQYYSPEQLDYDNDGIGNICDPEPFPKETLLHAIIRRVRWRIKKATAWFSTL